MRKLKEKKNRYTYFFEDTNQSVIDQNKKFMGMWNIFVIRNCNGKVPIQKIGRQKIRTASFKIVKNSIECDIVLRTSQHRLSWNNKWLVCLHSRIYRKGFQTFDKTYILFIYFFKKSIFCWNIWIVITYIWKVGAIL